MIRSDKGFAVIEGFKEEIHATKQHHQICVQFFVNGLGPVGIDDSPGPQIFWLGLECFCQRNLVLLALF